MATANYVANVSGHFSELIHKVQHFLNWLNGRIISGHALWGAEESCCSNMWPTYISVMNNAIITSMIWLVV